MTNPFMVRPRAKPSSVVQTKTLLSIDDDEYTLQIVHLALEMTAGWRVLIAHGGYEGLAIATAEQPDAILLDLVMSDIDGVDTFHKLKTNPATRHIPIILLTSRPDLAEHLQHSGLAVQGIITKPFDVLTFADQVVSALDWTD